MIYAVDIMISSCILIVSVVLVMVVFLFVQYICLIQKMFKVRCQILRKN